LADTHWLQIHSHQKSCGCCIGCSVTQMHILSRTTLATHTHTSEVLRSLYWVQRDTDTHLVTNHTGYTYTHIRSLAVAVLVTVQHRYTPHKQTFCTTPTGYTYTRIRALAVALLVTVRHTHTHLTNTHLADTLITKTHDQGSCGRCIGCGVTHRYTPDLSVSLQQTRCIGCSETHRYTPDKRTFC